MKDNSKRTIGGDFLAPGEQPGPKKPYLVKPFSLSASSFQPLKPFWKKSPGFAHASSSEGSKKYLQLTISNGTTAKDDNRINKENSIPSHAEKNPINGVGATSGVGNENNLAQTFEGKANPPGSGCNTQQEMDLKKLKRTMANRASAQRSRIRKNEYVEELEERAKFYQNKIDLLHPQISAYENRQRLLMIEQHKLRLQMATSERQRIIDEVEIEKNRAEVNRLRELHRKLIAEAQARTLNMGAAMQLMSNSNLNPSGFGRLICLNSDPAQNGVGASRVQTDISQQPQNQSHMWTDK